MLPLTYVVILLTQTDLNISTIVTNSNNYSDCVLGSVGGFLGGGGVCILGGFCNG